MRAVRPGPITGRHLYSLGHDGTLPVNKHKDFYRSSLHIASPTYLMLLFRHTKSVELKQQCLCILNQEVDHQFSINSMLSIAPLMLLTIFNALITYSC